MFESGSEPIFTRFRPGGGAKPSLGEPLFVVPTIVDPSSCGRAQLPRVPARGRAQDDPSRPRAGRGEPIKRYSIVKNGLCGVGDQRTTCDVAEFVRIQPVFWSLATSATAASTLAEEGSDFSNYFWPPPEK